MTDNGPAPPEDEDVLAIILANVRSVVESRSVWRRARDKGVLGPGWGAAIEKSLLVPKNEGGSPTKRRDEVRCTHSGSLASQKNIRQTYRLSQLVSQTNSHRQTLIFS